MGTQGNAAFLRWLPRYPLQFCNVCKMPDINVWYLPQNALWKYLMTAARRYCLSSANSENTEIIIEQSIEF